MHRIIDWFDGLTLRFEAWLHEKRRLRGEVEFLKSSRIGWIEAFHGKVAELGAEREKYDRLMIDLHQVKAEHGVRGRIVGELYEDRDALRKALKKTVAAHDETIFRTNASLKELTASHDQAIALAAERTAAHDKVVGWHNEINRELIAATGTIATLECEHDELRRQLAVGVKELSLFERRLAASEDVRRNLFDALCRQIEMVRGLLAIIGVPHPDDALVNAILSVDERILLKRARQTIEDFDGLPAEPATLVVQQLLERLRTNPTAAPV